MHYLLFTVGTVGDLNPYLGIGKGLRERAHDVTVLTNPGYESAVKSLGLEFVPVGRQEQLERYVNHPDYFDASKSWKLALDACFLGPMRQTFDIIAGYAASGPTTVVSAAWGLGARIAHEKLAVPLATIHLEPHNVRSMYQTGIMPPPMILGDWVPRFAKRMQFWIADRCFVDPRLSPKVNSFRRELGLPPVQRFTHQWWHSPQCVVGMYPDWLVPRQPDWPSQLELAGFPLWDKMENSELPDAAVEFAKRQRPVVFTAGSNNLHARGFFETAVACCEELGCCGLLIGKQPVDIPGGLSRRVKQFPYMGFSGLLPHASVLVHHGGAGTTAQALAAGVSQLVMPTVHGTPDIAARLKRLGVAETLKPSAFTVREGCRWIDHLMNSADVANQCRFYQHKMQSENAISRACDLLERLADQAS